MKVYVVVSHYHNVDSGESETMVERVFEDIVQAQAYMGERIKEERENLNHLDCEEDNYVEGDMSWSIWEKEQYMSHHCDIQIAESEVQK